MSDVLTATKVVQFIVWVFMTCTVSTASLVPDRNSGYAEEYCELETFRPQCLKNEVVVIESAVYGRRYVSRCLERENFDFNLNPSFLGCSADVMSYLSTSCSGKKQCEIRIPDANLQQAKPCPIGLDMFLEVRYSCVEVVEEDRSCVVSLTSSPLHIAGRSYSSSPQSNAGLHCGTRTQPWLLDAPAGQRINISLLEFTPTPAATATAALSSARISGSRVEPSRSPEDRCAEPRRQFGYVIDKSAASFTKKNVTVCSASGPLRLTNVCMSRSNVVELVLQSPTTELNESPDFLVRVEAVGCSDLVPPEDAWLKRTDNEAIIGCYTSRQTWHLKCEDRRWIGVVSNCTQYSFHQESSAEEHSAISVRHISDQHVLIVVAVTFLGVAVCLTIICCGVYCLRRYSTSSKKFLDDAKFQPGSKFNDKSTTLRQVTAAEASRDRSQQTANGDRSMYRFHNDSTPLANGTTSPHQYFVLEQNGVPMNNAS